MDWWLWRVGQRKKIKNKTKQTNRKRNRRNFKQCQRNFLTVIEQFNGILILLLFPSGQLIAPTESYSSLCACPKVSMTVYVNRCNTVC